MRGRDLPETRAQCMAVKESRRGGGEEGHGQTHQKDGFTAEINGTEDAVGDLLPRPGGQTQIAHEHSHWTGPEPSRREK